MMWSCWLPHGEDLRPWKKMTGLGSLTSLPLLPSHCLHVMPSSFNTSLSFLNRVATNLENLEYSGISLNMENSGNSQRILCNLGEKL